jgi:hypothetical protein
MIASTFTLAAHSLRRIRAVVAGMAIVLGAFQFLLTQVASYLWRSGGFGLMPSLVPDFLRQMAGPSMLQFMSFEGVVSFGYFHPVVVAAHLGLAIAIATEPAAEVEMRFADLTLARPIARHQAITRTVIVLVASDALVLIAMALATGVGAACCTPPDAPALSRSTIRSLALLLGSVTLCWGDIALAVAATMRRRATASAIAAVAALAAYLLDYLGRIRTPAESLSRLSPFHYFEPMTVVTGGSPNARSTAVMLFVGAAGIAIAYWIFSRRDV